MQLAGLQKVNEWSVALEQRLRRDGHLGLTVHVFEPERRRVSEVWGVEGRRVAHNLAQTTADGIFNGSKQGSLDLTTSLWKRSRESMAVAFDAKMTGGNAADGHNQRGDNVTTVSSTGMTVGASATLLVAVYIGAGSGGGIRAHGGHGAVGWWGDDGGSDRGDHHRSGRDLLSRQPSDRQ